MVIRVLLISDRSFYQPSSNAGNTDGFFFTLVYGYHVKHAFSKRDAGQTRVHQMPVANSF